VKKQTKGIIFFGFIGGIMMSSGVVIGIPGILPTEEGPVVTITGTPADNFPDEQRAQVMQNLMITLQNTKSLQSVHNL
jgi:virginiamycin B lyase